MFCIKYDDEISVDYNYASLKNNQSRANIGKYII